MVDHVLTVEELPHALTAYVSTGAPTRTPIQSPIHPQLQPESEPDYLQSVIALLQANVGLDFSGYKHGTLTRRIQRRMGLRHLDDVGDYLRLLRDSPDEITALFKALRIGVTGSFATPWHGRNWRRRRSNH